MYEMHYTGHGYPTMKEIEGEAKKRGFTHSYWGTDEGFGFKGLYNGDTIVVYDDINSLPVGLRMDAERFGSPIE